MKTTNKYWLANTLIMLVVVFTNLPHWIDWCLTMMQLYCLYMQIKTSSVRFGFEQKMVDWVEDKVSKLKVWIKNN